MSTDHLSSVIDHLMTSEHHTDRDTLAQEVHNLASEYRHVMKADLPENMPVGEKAAALTLMRHYPD
ncbi:MAG: hypothetical protein AAB544_00230 [Patescibacteria group bacterium]